MSMVSYWKASCKGFRTMANCRKIINYDYAILPNIFSSQGRGQKSQVTRSHRTMKNHYGLHSVWSLFQPYFGPKLVFSQVLLWQFNEKTNAVSPTNEKSLDRLKNLYYIMLKIVFFELRVPIDLTTSTPRVTGLVLLPKSSAYFCLLGLNY